MFLEEIIKRKKNEQVRDFRHINNLCVALFHRLVKFLLPRALQTFPPRQSQQKNVPFAASFARATREGRKSYTAKLNNTLWIISINNPQDINTFSVYPVTAASSEFQMSEVCFFKTFSFSHFFLCYATCLWFTGSSLNFLHNTEDCLTAALFGRALMNHFET